MRSPKAQCARGRRSVRDAAPLPKTLELDSADPTAGHRDLEPHRFRRSHISSVRPSTGRRLGAGWEGSDVDAVAIETVARDDELLAGRHIVAHE